MVIFRSGEKVQKTSKFWHFSSFSMQGQLGRARRLRKRAFPIASGVARVPAFQSASRMWQNSPGKHIGRKAVLWVG